MSRKVRDRAALLYALALGMLLAPVINAAWQSNMSRLYVALLFGWMAVSTLAIGFSIADTVARALFYRRYTDGE